MIDLILEYYVHPYTFFGMFLILIFYGFIHQCRSDSIIKKHNLNLRFLNKLFIFRIPSQKRQNDTSEVVWADIQKLAKEYTIVNSLIFAYFIFGALIFYF